MAAGAVGGRRQMLRLRPCCRTCTTSSCARGSALMGGRATTTRGGRGGDGGRYLRHASSLLDLMERRHSSSPSAATSWLSLRLADSSNAMGRARCYALVLDGHVHFSLFRHSAKSALGTRRSVQFFFSCQNLICTFG